MPDLTQILFFFWTVVVFLVGVLVGFLLFGGDPQRSGWQAPPQPKWTEDTIEGAIEWVSAALDAGKEKW